MGAPGGIDRVRSIFERAVTAVGLHMTKGHAVWEAYREFENAILSTVQVCISFSEEGAVNFLFLHLHIRKRQLDK